MYYYSAMYACSIIICAAVPCEPYIYTYSEFSAYRYLERLSDSLHQQLRLADRALSQAADHTARREEATALAVDLEPKLTSLVKCVKDLQKQVRIIL